MEDIKKQCGDLFAQFGLYILFIFFFYSIAGDPNKAPPLVQLSFLACTVAPVLYFALKVIAIVEDVSNEASKKYREHQSRQSQHEKHNYQASEDQGPVNGKENSSANIKGIFDNACREIGIHPEHTTEQLKMYWRLTCRQWHP